MLTATGSHSDSHSSAVGAGLTAGLGFLVAVFALWSMFAVDPTHDHWTLTIAGFALLVAPWVAGFVGDRAAWIAWTGGSRGGGARRYRLSIRRYVGPDGNPS